MKSILLIIFSLLIYFITILIAGKFDMWSHTLLLASFFTLNHFNRAWVKEHQRFNFGIRISKIEKLVLFPILPNLIPKGSVKFQRVLLVNTLISLILMLTVFRSGVLVLFQLIIVPVHFIAHIVLIFKWAK